MITHRRSVRRSLLVLATAFPGLLVPVLPGSSSAVHAAPAEGIREFVGDVVVEPDRAKAEQVSLPDVEPLPEEILRDYRSVFPGVSDEDFQEFWRYQRARRAVLHQAARYPELSAQWFDFGTQTQYFAATSEGVARELAAAGTKAGIPTSGVVMEHTYAELDALRVEVEAILIADGVEQYELSVRAPMNHVLLRIRPTDAVALHIPEDERLTVAITDDIEVGIPAACVSRWSCTVPLAGGINFSAKSTSTQPGTSGCTIGFTATKPSSGARYFYTAGHCIDPSDIGRTYYQGSRAVGDARKRVYSGAVDAAGVAITSSYWLGGSRGWMYGSSLSSPVAVNWRLEYASLVDDGDPVCQLGRSFLAGHDNCGVISARNVTGRPQVAGVRTCAGDSGGSVYLLLPGPYREAWGLISVTSPRDPITKCTGNGRDQDRMSFSSFPHINPEFDTNGDTLVDVR